MNKEKRNKLKYTHPEIAAQFHPTKNGDLKVEELAYRSAKKIWWQCSNGHDYLSAIEKRTNGRNCPYCSGKKVCLDNCLATLKPELAKQWHPTKNDDLTPYDVTVSSSKEVWWLCEKGHSYKCKIVSKNGCKYCTNQAVCDDNSLEFINPDVCKYWDCNMNSELTPKDVVALTSKKVYWKCDFGHVTLRSVYSQRNGFKCSECIKGRQSSMPEQIIYYYLNRIFPDAINRYILKTDEKKIEIDIFIPSLSVGIEYDGYYHKDKQEKDSEKNAVLSRKIKKLIRVRTEELPKLNYPCDLILKHKNGDLQSLEEIIKSIMNFLVQQCNIKEKTYEDLNQLSDININEDMNLIYDNIKTIKNNKSLSTTHPELSEEWDYKRNGNLKPEHFTYGMNTKVYWECLKGHSYKMSINSRVRGGNCTICSNNTITEENCLKTTHPEICNEWNFEKNNITPNDVTFGSNTKVWWICEKGHNWKTNIASRTTKSGGCPYCSNKKVCEDNCLNTIRPDLATEWDYNKNKLTPYDVTYGSNKKAWWICNKRHSWEAVVSSRNQGSGCPYCINQKFNEDNCLATLSADLLSEWNFEKNKNITPYEVGLFSNKKVWWKCHKNHTWNATISSRSSGHGCPYCAGSMPTEEINLGILYPILSKEWHPIKNNNKNPFDFLPNSGIKVWWKCEKGHEWEAVIGSRTNGHNCPYCMGLKATKENNLSVAFPEIALELHPMRNGNLKPADITPRSNRKLWWQCGKGHEWQDTVDHRTSGRGCSYCTGRKACDDNNLTVTHPELVLEWNLSKNNELKPQDVTYRSSKKVWWTCRHNNSHEWSTRVSNRAIQKTGCPHCYEENRSNKNE